MFSELNDWAYPATVAMSWSTWVMSSLRALTITAIKERSSIPEMLPYMSWVVKCWSMRAVSSAIKPNLTVLEASSLYMKETGFRAIIVEVPAMVKSLISCFVERSEDRQASEPAL